MSATYETYWVLGQQVKLLATGETTDGRYALIEILMPVGVDGPPPHIHQDCDESFHVLEGEIEVLRGDTWTRLGKNGLALVPRGTLHTFRNVGHVAAQVLSVFTPCGFEKFFREMGTPAPAAITPETIGKVINLAPQVGMVIPPPPKG